MKSVRNQVGTSLVELVIFMGISALLFMGTATLIGDSAKSAQTVKMSADFATIGLSVSQTLGKERSCTDSLKGVIVDPATFPHEIQELKLPSQGDYALKQNLVKTGVMLHGILISKLEFDRVFQYLGTQSGGGRAYLVRFHLQGEKPTAGTERLTYGKKSLHHYASVVLEIEPGTNVIQKCY